MRIPPLALVASRPRIVAATRRRASGWSFTGTTCLLGDGASGSYAESVNAAAATIILPGTVLGTGSMLCWLYDTMMATSVVMNAAAAVSARYARMQTTSSTLRAVISDDAASTQTASIASADAKIEAGYALCVCTFEHAASDTIKAYCDDLTPAEAVDASPGAYTAATKLRLFATHVDSAYLSGRIRSPAVFSRVLSADEVAALVTLGPTHDLRVASGDYLGSPAHWWPGDGDSGTTVTDRGSVGGCNLTLNGGVTLEAA